MAKLELRSSFFRVIHVDGAFGGLTGRGYINAALYSERRAVPRVTEQKYNENGLVGTEQIIRSRQNVVREVEVDVMLDYGAAVAIRDWLDRKIKEHDKVFGKTDGS